MENFWQELQQRTNSNSRIFVVERDMLDNEQKPTVLADLLGYPFWLQDRDGKAPRILGDPKPDPLDRLYYDKITDLATDLAAELNRLKVQGEQPLQPMQHLMPQPISATDTRPTVFLAEVTDDMDVYRDRVQRHLDQEGFRVIPSETSHYFSYLTGNNVKETLTDELKQCKLFVQLLSQLTGKCPPGLPSFPALQHQVALSANIPVLQWHDPDLKLESIAPSDHLNLLKGDTVLVMGLEEFKQELITRLNRQDKKPKPKVNPNLVFLNTNAEDMPLGENIGLQLKNHEIGFTLPIRSDDSKQLQEDMELSIAECDGLIFIYSASTQAWAKAQVLRSRRIIAERERPLKVWAVYKGIPDESASLVDLPGLLMLNYDSDLAPFVAALQTD